MYMHIEKHIVDNKFPRKSSLCFTSPCFTSPCFTSPCFTSPVHVLQVQSMVYKSSPWFTSPVHGLQVQSMFYKSSPWFTSPVHVLQVQSMFYKSSPWFTSPVHVLQVQSMVYKSSPIQGSVHVLQHASRPANHSSKSLSTKSTRKLLFHTLSSLKFAKIHKQQYLDENLSPPQRLT